MFKQKFKQNEKGITLIALVVTIVVLLILAGVSINLVIGNNGIITKATETSVAQAHAQVRDAIMLAYGEYQVNMYTSKNINTSKEIKIAATTGVATGTSQQTFLEFLQDKGYIDENGIVNVENLLGTKLKLGNGSNDKDVYKVEEGEGSYVLNYYEKDGTTTKLDTIAPISTESSKITYTQADIDETLKYFTFDEETGVLITNEDMIGSDYKNKTYPTKVVIPKEINGVKVTSLKSLNSYYTAFGLFSHSNVEEVVILAKINEISSKMFYGCSKLSSVELPNSVTSFGEYAFKDCESLTSITIPSKVTSIGERAFSDCTGLTSITIPINVTNIENSAFYGCTSLTSVTLSDSITNIGNSAFSYCTRLTSITIPDSVTSIGQSAFFGCTGLTNITIPSSVTSIENYAFYNCKSLTSITIPSSVTSIEKYAFYNCTSLTSITIPSSVTSIGSYAFIDCTSLTSITIPSSVTSIGSSAFRNCTSLQNVYYTGTEEQWNAITIGSSNDPLTNATKTYNYVEE